MLALVLLVRISAENFDFPYTQSLNYQSWCCKVRGDYRKARATEYLNGQSGPHLVIVKAKQEASNLLQWIYNDADIDASRIVWARDLGPWRNAELMAYFEGRQVWRLDPNEENAVLRPVSLPIPVADSSRRSTVRTGW